MIVELARHNQCKPRKNLPNLKKYCMGVSFLCAHRLYFSYLSMFAVSTIMLAMFMAQWPSIKLLNRRISREFPFERPLNLPTSLAKQFLGEARPCSYIKSRVRTTKKESHYEEHNESEMATYANKNNRISSESWYSNAFTEHLLH